MIGFKRTAIMGLLAVGVGFTGVSQASLVDRGNGLLYDSVLNVTWLQDANYAKTSGYSATGLMDWATATTWAANLNFDGLTGWRLATNTPVSGGASYNYNFSTNGSTDFSFNITSPKSELAYMYYVNLGLKGRLDAAGNYQSNLGIFGNGFNGGQSNVGLVHNLQSYTFWSGAECPPWSDCAWAFDTTLGLQRNDSEKFFPLYAWAVHPGDVAAIPLPGAVWLFGSGLIGLLSFKRRKNKTANVSAA